MKKLFIIGLSLIIIGASWQKIIIFSAYSIKTDYIATVLCINKNTSSAKACNGKCYLSAKFKQQEKSEDIPGPNTSFQEFNFLFTRSTISFLTNSAKEYVVELTDWSYPAGFKNPVEIPPEM